MFSVLKSLDCVESIELRSRARVPIISLVHRNGVSCDLSVGEVTSKTEAFIEEMKAFGCCNHFNVLCSFLKVLLNQHCLDKPFNGGIGSYKLYIMVATAMMNCQQVFLEREPGRSAEGNQPPDPNLTQPNSI